MKIVADENIPFALEAFGTLGDVELISGRDATAETFRDCDVFFTRSVTKVNEQMFGDSPVRFVGTATIGTDHVDRDFLAQRGIAFASAPGSNANSVAEYVTASLLVMADRNGTRLEGKSIGVVGVGNVGSRVVAKAEALGMHVLQNDPPLARETGEARFVPLDDLMGVDFLTFHTPLTREGQDATWHLCDEARMRQLQLSAVILNTSRGPVVANEPLKEHLSEGWLGGGVLDVWETEPLIDLDLLDKVAIATPHIAGYSFDGKVSGTEMVYRAACEALGLEPTWDPASVMPEPEVPGIEIDCTDMADEDIIRAAVLTVYDILADDHDFREMPDDPDEHREFFDQLRKTYPQRREFHNTLLVLHGASDGLKAKLTGIGFQVQDA